MTLGNAVAERLAALDPGRAVDYTANAQALETELTTLGEEFTRGLASCARTEFITSHAAFGYLAERYGLTQISIGGLSPDAEPSRLESPRSRPRRGNTGITTIFYETLVSPDVATAIAGDLGLKTDVLDPVEGITADSRGTDYLAGDAVQPDRAQDGERMPVSDGQTRPSWPPRTWSSSSADRRCSVG